jgi:iron complex transport system substrate-binding protein
MQSFTDHLDRKVFIPSKPARIVSLCPSQTETLIALGLRDRMAGRTLFCIHPESVREIPSVGGTKNCKPEKILSMRPDLVIAEKEENTAELVASLDAEVPVFVTDVHDLDSALRMVRDLGMITGESQAGENLAAQIQKAIDALPQSALPRQVLYLIWQKPWMAAGNATFIGAMLRRIGLENVCINPQGRYPELSDAEITQLAPDVVLLSSEPFPFKEKHIESLQRLLPDSRILLTDGEIFSWYGARFLNQF